MRREDILKKVLVFDGAMGTMLQAEGLKPGYCPELMNIEYPDKVKKVHELYLKSGADVITTNTFGGNKIKLSEYGLEDRLEEINIKAVQIAKEAIGNLNAYVAASVGPSGQFVKPIGNAEFEHIYELFKEQIGALSKANPDFILLETFSDLGEIRAALLAAKDVCDIPVICSLTYDGERTLTGVSPEVSAVVLESLGASAVGVNCSGGPKELFNVVKKISETTRLPVIVQPNAGLPQFKDGEIYYPLNPKEFIDAMKPYFDLGINIFGSCCGSTPDHTKELKNTLKDFNVQSRDIEEISTLSSRERVVEIGNSFLPKIVGERINPTANKKIANGLKNEDFGVIQNEAQIQVKCGSHILDINVGYPDINEIESMSSVINLIQQSINAPLVIDSTNPSVIEKALKTYHGKALVNSINGEENSLNNILPLIKRYGCGVIALTLDENGIPKTADERYVIAEKIIKRCVDYGISKKDIYIDPLALTVGTDTKAAIETLKALKMIKEGLGVNTVLGVSNISHGLPNKGKINSSFFAMAIANGLDLAIINPCEESMIDAWQSASLLSGRDDNASNYINLNKKTNSDLKEVDNEEVSIEKLKDLVVTGSHYAVNVVESLLDKGTQPIEIINKGLIEGLNIVGYKFEDGEYFLPQLMMSAEVSQKIFKLLETKFGGSSVLESKATIVIGTVKGDVHDIGKNMVAVMLRSHGFNVIDLGKNVSKEEFLEAAQRENADFIGLSALMTTTMIEIPNTIEYVKKNLRDIKIIVGGAVVTEEFAKRHGADGYSKDAVDAVKLVENLLNH